MLFKRIFAIASVALIPALAVAEPGPMKGACQERCAGAVRFDPAGRRSASRLYKRASLTAIEYL